MHQSYTSVCTRLLSTVSVQSPQDASPARRSQLTLCVAQTILLDSNEQIQLKARMHNIEKSINRNDE